MLELTSKLDFQILVCEMYVLCDKDDSTRNGIREFLTSSLTLHMKGLNISEVSKSYKPQNVWGSRYEETAGLNKYPQKAMQIISNHMQKVPKIMVYDWDILTCQLSYIHHAYEIFLRTGWIRYYWQMMLSSLFSE